MTASVLTNTSAMIALQTLRDTNDNLREVNNQISTGKKVATAKDNAAVFAITEVMSSDVSGFQAISESLSLGQATVAVASNASNQIGDLLDDIKQKIVAAQESNVDRGKLQDEIVSLRNQVDGIVSAAQFNGRNLIDGSVTGPTAVQVLSSLDRDAAGNVTSSTIDVEGFDLSQATAAAPTGFTAAGTDGITADGANVAVVLGAGANTTDIQINAAGLAAGQQFKVTIGSETATYTVTADDVAATSAEDSVAAGLRDAINGLGLSNFLADNNATDPNIITLTNQVGAPERTVSATAEGASTGGLSDLGNIDVTVDAASALTDIEGLIQTVVDAQAAFGTAEKRLDLQSDFMSSLIDSFETGIGGLVDADLEEASARLQALQVQQQLGTQALSIANQQPQNLLALFR